MNKRNSNYRFRFFWTALITVVWLPAISAQTNTFPSTGSAGVGTTNPSQKLEVSGGTVKITGGGLFVDNDQAIRAGGGDQSLIYRSSSNGIYFGSGDPNDFLVLNAGGAERFRLATNGRAGLGTNNPSAMFDVSNPNGNLWSHWAHSTATTGQNYGILINAGTNSSDFSFRAQNAAGSAELFSVRGDGNIGIGTANPNSALHILKDMGNSVSASLRVRSPNTTARTTRIQLEDYNASTADALIDFVNTDASAANWYLGLGVDSSSQLVLRRGGTTGIGVTNPVDRFVVRGFNGNGAIEFGNNIFNGGLFANSLASYDRVASAYKDLRLISDSSNSTLVLQAGGNVGIGTASPGYKLDVNGTINSNSTITANNIVAKYQDVAEWVPASEQLSAGTVVVLDSTKSNQVTSSSVSYDTRVAGVVSEQPGIALGEKSEGKVLVATTGRVRVKVDATKGPIHIGDLLVTSDVPGVAMKSEAVNLGGVQFHRPGTLIGKALEPLEKGKDEILVLLSLQ